MYLIKKMFFKERIEEKVTVVKWQHLRKPIPLPSPPCYLSLHSIPILSKQQNLYRWPTLEISNYDVAFFCFLN